MGEVGGVHGRAEDLDVTMVDLVGRASTRNRNWVGFDTRFGAMVG